MFGVSAGVPTLGIAVDEYTTTTAKLTGALGNFGQPRRGQRRRPAHGWGHAASRALWAEHDAIRSTGRLRAAESRAASAAWWDRVAVALQLAAG